MNPRYQDASLSGLEKMRSMIEAGERPPMMKTLGFELVEIAEGFAAFEGEPGANVYNPLGSIHGGYAATLLDSACGCAAHASLPAGKIYTTLELKVAFHRGMTHKTGLVRAEGRVLSVGRRVAFAEAKLTDREGRLHASATSTLLIFDMDDTARPRGS